NVLATTENKLAYTAMLPSFNKSVSLKTDDSTLGSTVEARIIGGSVVTASGSVSVQAEQTGSILAVADAATIARKDRSWQVSAAMVTNTLADKVSAHIDNSTVVAQGGDVNVELSMCAET